MRVEGGGFRTISSKPLSMLSLSEKLSLPETVSMFETLPESAAPPG
jgi:hypothetical protein